MSRPANAVPKPRRKKKAPRAFLSRSPIKKKKRSAKEDARIYGPKAFREFLHRSPCLICGYQGEAIQQAHLMNGGVGFKSGWQHTAPLCGPRYIEGKPFDGCHSIFDRHKKSMSAAVLARAAIWFAGWVSGDRFGDPNQETP